MNAPTNDWPRRLDAAIRDALTRPSPWTRGRNRIRRLLRDARAEGHESDVAPNAAAFETIAERALARMRKKAGSSKNGGSRA